MRNHRFLAFLTGCLLALGSALPGAEPPVLPKPEEKPAAPSSAGNQEAKKADPAAKKEGRKGRGKKAREGAAQSAPAKEQAPEKAKQQAPDKAKEQAKEAPKDKEKVPPAKAESPEAKAATASSAKKPSGAAAKEKEKASATVVRIVLRGGLSEGPEPPGIFGEMRQSLSAVIRRMDQAGEDSSVAAVLLEIQDLDVGQGKVHELRTAIERLRKSGKPVLAELSSADASEYLVAAACQEIALAPSGTILIPGARAEVTFYKELLDKLGLKYDVLQMGRFKGAAETFTRTGMSPALRESMEAMVDDAYSALVSAIAKDRKLDAYQVKELVDQGLFTAAAAKNARLVDHVAYHDEVLDILKKQLKADGLRLVAETRKRPSEAELSGIGGMMKMMEMMLGGGRSPEKSSAERKIAVIYAVGPILDGESGASLLGERILGGRTLVNALRLASDDPKVLAIVLRIESPGGSAVASDLVWREVQRIKKPVIASMGDVAASGGYYIAMGAKKVLAEPGTVTGSIGVVGGKLVTGGLYEKLGVTTEVISRGRNSGSLSSNQPFTKAEREAWTAVLEETYRQFVDKAAEGRKMSRDKLEQLAQGRVYTGRMAAANGLVDGLGTLYDALAEAKRAAGLKPEEKIELLILPRPRTFFEQLFNEPSVTERLATALPGSELLLKADLFRRLFRERVLTVMPYQVKVE